MQFTDLSTDTDGTIVSYYWNLSDGITSTEKNPYHKYNESGVYIITLNVTDDVGATNTSSHTILVEESQNKDITNTETNEGTPSFEQILLLCAIMVSIIMVSILILKKKSST
jgi:PKD repeat protein